VLETDAAGDEPAAEEPADEQPSDEDPTGVPAIEGSELDAIDFGGEVGESG
jgi:hypothetical protein